MSYAIPPHRRWFESDRSPATLTRLLLVNLTIAGGGGGCIAARSEIYRLQRIETDCVACVASLTVSEIMC